MSFKYHASEQVTKLLSWVEYIIGCCTYDHHVHPIHLLSTHFQASGPDFDVHQVVHSCNLPNVDAPKISHDEGRSLDPKVLYQDTKTST